jgi:hypothetical protein
VTNWRVFSTILNRYGTGSWSGKEMIWLSSPPLSTVCTRLCGDEYGFSPLTISTHVPFHLDVHFVNPAPVFDACFLAWLQVIYASKLAA